MLIKQKQMRHPFKRLNRQTNHRPWWRRV